jgi:hypothetical protein
LLSDALAIAISLVCKFCLNCVTFKFNETQDFDVEHQVFWQNMQRQVVGVLNYFLSFMLSFQKPKTHNMLCIMLNPHYKDLGLVIQFVGKERAL